MICERASSVYPRGQRGFRGDSRTRNLFRALTTNSKGVEQKRRQSSSRYDTYRKYTTITLKPGKYTFGMEFIREKAGKYQESLGKATLYVNEEVAAQGDMKTQPGKFTLSGDGLCVGRDSGDAVSEKYKSPGEFKGGTIKFVGVTVEKSQYLDLEKLAAAAFAVD